MHFQLNVDGDSRASHLRAAAAFLLELAEAGQGAWDGPNARPSVVTTGNIAFAAENVGVGPEATTAEEQVVEPTVSGDTPAPAATGKRGRGRPPKVVEPAAPVVEPTPEPVAEATPAVEAAPEPEAVDLFDDEPVAATPDAPPARDYTKADVAKVVEAVKNTTDLALKSERIKVMKESFTKFGVVASSGLKDEVLGTWFAYVLPKLCLTDFE